MKAIWLALTTGAALVAAIPLGAAADAITQGAGIGAQEIKQVSRLQANEIAGEGYTVPFHEMRGHAPISFGRRNKTRLVPGTPFIEPLIGDRSNQ